MYHHIHKMNQVLNIKKCIKGLQYLAPYFHLYSNTTINNYKKKKSRKKNE